MVGGLDFDIFDVDVDLDGDVDGDVDGHGAAASFLDVLGLSGLPVTIAISLLVFFGWVASLFLTESLDGVIPEDLPFGLTRWGIGIGALLIAIPFAALVARPIKRKLKTQQAVHKHDLIGRGCRITTQRVTDSFGQGEIDDGGAGILAEVRCDHVNGMKRHSRAIVVGFDRDADAFSVEADPAQDSTA